MTRALTKTMAQTMKEEDNSIRSARWIRLFHAELAKTYSKQDGYRVFSRGITKEKLYDITVYKQSSVESVDRRATLHIPLKCKWQIESELEISDSRVLTDDLGKLVLGAADNKLFIASNTWNKSVKKRTWIEQTASKVANACSGTFYLAFIPHPGIFHLGVVQPTVRLWTGEEWKDF